MAVSGFAQTSTVTLPTYESNREIQQYATKPEYQAAVADRRFVLERMLYTSDAGQVSAYVYRPRAAKQKLPVIVFIRGSYIVQNQAPPLLSTFHRLAREGFVVVAPMLRGSDGQPGHDEMGGAELNDIREAIALLAKLPYADSARVFLYGQSRGGIMTYLALRAAMPVRAGAVFGAITNIEQYLESDPRAAAMREKIWPDWSERKDEIQASRSAALWAGELAAPVLIMHAAGDPQVPPTHALTMAAELQRHKKPYSLFIVEGDNHRMQEHRHERDRQAVLWFRRHMEPPAAAAK
jgi:dipeptidyl aminopeptidase/acylaminoacyl peptidase